MYKRNCKNGYQFAAQSLQEAIIQGLICNKVDVSVITIPCLPTYPFGYKRAFLTSDDFIINNKKIGHTIGCFNVPLMKIEFGYRKIIDQWFLQTKGEKYILIYSLSARLFKIAKYIKTKYPDTTIGVVVADLPEYMSWNRYYSKLGLRKRDENIIYNNLCFIDKFILLSKHMVCKLPIVNKPWIVIEGIFNPISDKIPTNDQRKAKAILYTGNIDQRYGIMDVVRAFSLIPDKDILFWICGFGDSENDIKALAEKDRRIVYFGALPRIEVLKLQRKASLLINPRHSNEEFTRYSFPSKTMEYLASGTPTLMCKLECIPKEYDKYLLYIEDESIEGYKNAMLDIIQKDELNLRLFGEKARQFILENKIPSKQAKKIIDFLISGNNKKWEK